jgi:Domain of unknown function (DUF4410)
MPSRGGRKLWAISLIKPGHNRKKTGNCGFFLLVIVATNTHSTFFMDSTNRATMNRHTKVVLSFLLITMLVGCASTKVTQQTPIRAAGLARPNQIWVYDFAASATDVPPDSSIANTISASSASPTDKQVQTGRQLGALIAQDLVADIQAMGLPAIHAGPSATPQVGDGVIRGYLVSVEGGGVAKRFVIGFGYGSSEMDTLVEGYVMTPQGLRKLGSGTLSSSGSKTPGVIVPAAVTIATGNPIGLIVVGGTKILGEATGRNALEGRARATADEIADQLRIRFQDRGWIS